MKVIGLTGGIGSGKSTFCEFMAEHGIATIDTDQIARQVVEPGSEGLNALIKTFGVDILQADGHLDRAAMRQRIFADPENPKPRQQLEAILHPLIQTETEAQIHQYKHNPDYQQAYLLVAIPLLIEGILKRGGNNKNKPHYLDEIWVLDCPEALQIARASKRDSSDQTQIKNILANQASRKQRRQYADKVIDNSGSSQQLKQQINRLLQQS